MPTSGARPPTGVARRGVNAAVRAAHKEGRREVQSIHGNSLIDRREGDRGREGGGARPLWHGEHLRGRGTRLRDNRAAVQQAKRGNSSDQGDGDHCAE